MSADSVDLISAIGALVADAIDDGTLESYDMSRNAVDTTVPDTAWRTSRPGREITITLVLADAE